MKSGYASIVMASMLVAACGGGSGNAPAPVNAAPTISAIPDQSTAANQTSQAIGFTVSDEQPGDLSFTTMSDNQRLIPDAGLALGGSAGSRNITVTPTFDMLGDAFITIIVTDRGGLSASSSFLLTIDAEQKSIQQFTRSSYAESADGEPDLVNAIEFAQDADDDDFADLLAQ